MLNEAGFKCYKPDGAYYIMTDISGFGFADDVAFTQHLIRDIGVAVVPGSSFYRQSDGGQKQAQRQGSQQVRFTYCKRAETLQAAAEKLQKLK